ncbi:transcriptional regulator domain-containing protein [Sphingobium yanoikuyae]
MWEWLRRDSGYIAWHAGSRASTHGAADPGQWGLHFR